MSAQTTATLITAFAGIVGAALGGALSWFVGYSADARRWKREDARRFDQDRRVVYAALLSAVAGIQALYQPGREASAEDETAAWKSFTEALSHIDILGSPVVRTKAWDFAAITASAYSLGSGTKTIPGKWLVAKDDLLAAMRRDLGIPDQIESPAVVLGRRRASNQAMQRTAR